MAEALNKLRTGFATVVEHLGLESKATTYDKATHTAQAVLERSNFWANYTGVKKALVTAQDLDPMSRQALRTGLDQLKLLRGDVLNAIDALGEAAKAYGKAPMDKTVDLSLALSQHLSLIGDFIEIGSKEPSRF